MGGVNVHRLTQGDRCQLQVNPRVGWVQGVVTYVNEHGGTFIIDTEKHGRFSVTPGHPDLRAAA